MSFSSSLKTELGKARDKARHCRIAFLAALVSFAGDISEGEGGRLLNIYSENEAVAKSAAELMERLTGGACRIHTEKSARNHSSFSVSAGTKTSVDISEILNFHTDLTGEVLPEIPSLTGKGCCKRAFLRGAFLGGGSVSNPDRFYHFEIQSRRGYVVENVCRIMNELGLSAKIIERQKHFVVYLKEIEQIADAVALMGARTSLLELENSRIVRQMRGSINRRVNCETANINKTALASARQIEDILFIKEHMGFSSLPNGLDEVARIRLEYPEATLVELGSYLEPPIGKSGVNHRLRKLSSIAKGIRSRGGDYYDKEAGNDTDCQRT